MAGKVAGNDQKVASSKYELSKGNPNHVRTIVATENQTRPWIDPSLIWAIIKLVNIQL